MLTGVYLHIVHRGSKWKETDLCETIEVRSVKDCLTYTKAVERVKEEVEIQFPKYAKYIGKNCYNDDFMATSGNKATIIEIDKKCLDGSVEKHIFIAEIVQTIRSQVKYAFIATHVTDEGNVEVQCIALTQKLLSAYANAMEFIHETLDVFSPSISVTLGSAMLIGRYQPQETKDKYYIWEDFMQEETGAYDVYKVMALTE